jgi:hypothetical protein
MQTDCLGHDSSVDGMLGSSSFQQLSDEGRWSEIPLCIGKVAGLIEALNFEEVSQCFCHVGSS